MNNNDSINLLQIFSLIYKERIFVLKFITVFFIVGFLFALGTKKKFSSHTTFVPQLSSSSNTSSSLSGIASIAGIKISDTSQSSEISPLLYPQLIESVPFRLELLQTKIIDEGEKKTIRNFLLNEKSFNLFSTIKKYTIGLPSLLISYLDFSKNQQINNNDLIGIYSLSEEDQRLFSVLSGLLKISLDEKDRFVTLSSTHYKKNIPAQITKNAELILQKKIIEIKSKFSKELLEFSEEQYFVKRKELESLQDQIGKFKDQNININSSLFQNKLDRLLSEFQILQSVVQQLASQVEQAKLQVNKDTPIFTVIQPVNIPFNDSGPSKSLIIIAFVLVGIFVSSFYIVLKRPIKIILKKIIA